MSNKDDKVIANISNAVQIPDSVKKVFNDVKGMSKTNQILIGGCSGLACGYAVRKVGKLTGIVIGGGILALQVAQHFGYIQINWKKVQKDFEKHKNKTINALKKSGASNSSLERFIGDTKSFVVENVTFAISFAGGLLVGFSF